MQSTEQIAQSTRRNLSKTYIPGETKGQRKARKSKEKTQKNAEVSQPSPQTSDSILSNRFVCCLKYGSKYDASYVNKLYHMVKRNLTLDHQFVCFTENPEGLDKDIRVEPLPQLPVQGWWFKPMFFNPKLNIRGTLLFLDLDIIIFRNIDHLFTFNPGEFCIIRDFNRYIIKDYAKFNSSVFRLTSGQHARVYNNFIKDPKAIMKRFPGDQDWIRKEIVKDYTYWPDNWIMSYKWEMRGKPKFNSKPRGSRDFLIPGDPAIKEDTSIAVFHGDPNPHNCKDPWVIDNWK